MENLSPSFRMATLNGDPGVNWKPIERSSCPQAPSSQEFLMNRCLPWLESENKKLREVYVYSVDLTLGGVKLSVLFVVVKE